MATYRSRSSPGDLPEELRDFVVRDWLDVPEADPLWSFVSHIGLEARATLPYCAHIIAPARYRNAVVDALGPVLGEWPAHELAHEIVGNWAGALSTREPGACPCEACP